MSFQSVEYAVFLPAIFVLFLLLEDRFRWAALLAASVFFYSVLGNPLLPATLLWVVVATYLSTMLAERYGTARGRRIVLLLGAFCILTPLVALRYIPLLCARTPRAGLPGWLSFLQAGGEIGVSFYTFQALSYLFDVYLGSVKAERHLGYLALSLSFFPKLLQGPIERAESLIPQLRRPYVLDYSKVRSGLVLIGWGLFKKAVIADHLAAIVASAYDHPEEFPGISLLIATYLYAAQLYCDFSGYTDMAIGSARLFSIQLSPNFRSPYLATSIADFWRRWHISLSRWLLDYLFKPLQMVLRKHQHLANPLAILVTFVVCGLWHGARWNFLVWGTLHGFFMAASYLTGGFRSRMVELLRLRRRPRLHRLVQVAVCFNLVSIGWIFFRASSLTDGVYILRRIFSGPELPLGELASGELATRMIFLNQPKIDLLIPLFGMGIMTGIHFLSKRGDLKTLLFDKPVWFRWAVYYALLFSIMILGNFKSTDFIYFKF